DPRAEGGQELGPEAADVERCERLVARLRRVQPLDERGDVDLDLAVRDRGGAVRLDARRGRAVAGEALLAAEMWGLVARPGGEDGGEREEERREELDVARPRRRGRRVVAQEATPFSSQRFAGVKSIARAPSSISFSVRSIAVGLSPPTPDWYGLSRN